MSDNISLIIPKKPETYLAFLPIEDKVQQDVHVGLEGSVLVIGSNPKSMYHSATGNEFTDPCLIIEADGCRLQYRDENGKVASKDLDAHKVSKEILKMLKKMKKW